MSPADIAATHRASVSTAELEAERREAEADLKSALQRMTYHELTVGFRIVSNRDDDDGRRLVEMYRAEFASRRTPQVPNDGTRYILAPFATAPHRGSVCIAEDCANLVPTGHGSDYCGACITADQADK